MPFDRNKMQAAAAALAADGVFVGTSSWKYAGWRGQLYTTDRYIWQGRLAESRFEQLCLSEYAEVFRTVCVDAMYYKFPDPRTLERLVAQVPNDFLFTFKVTDEITLKRFPDVPRCGDRAGLANPSFLSAERFERVFLGPCEPFRANVGLLIFEFSHFSPQDFERGRDFLEALDQFLGRLPGGWRYGVELRNRTFLQPEYFATLSRHGVAHIFSSWQNMTPLPDQVALSESRTNPDFLGARLLLRPGRKYEEAVKQFSPYNRIQDPYPEGRTAAARLIRETRARHGATKAFLYVNNRFEGNALETIAATLEEAGAG
jgi:uncharacterized protein YecE (DUF72 family)